MFWEDNVTHDFVLFSLYPFCSSSIIPPGTFPDCIMGAVNNVKSRSVNWYHNADLLNHDITRGGVSIKTEITADHAKSILQLARITRRDIGTYLCSAPPQNATVTVHILNGK